MRDDLLVFGAPKIEQEEIDEVVDTLRSGWLGTGPKAARFESAFAAYKGVPYAAALNSCTAGLHLSLLVLDLKPGDEVITTPMTFCATVNAIIHAGGTPVLADVDPATGNIDPREIRRCITERTKVLLPVHYAGRACEMDEICALAAEYRLRIVEDCAHAIETEYRGRKAGTFGDIGAFSFYVTKNVATGEGGMVISRDQVMIARIRELALHGMSRDAWKRFEDSDKIHYTITEPGFKYNMMDIQAALGIHQLARVEKNWLRRAQIWAAYSRELADLPLTLPAPVARNTRHAYHLFTILIGEAEAGIDRDEFIRQMKKRLVSASVHYRSIPEFEYYQRRYGWRPQRWRNAAYIGRRTVSLPLSPRMTDADVESVIEATRAILVGVRAARLPLPITAGSDTEARIEQGDYALLHHGD